MALKTGVGRLEVSAEGDVRGGTVLHGAGVTHGEGGHARHSVEREQTKGGVVRLVRVGEGVLGGSGVTSMGYILHRERGVDTELLKRYLPWKCPAI